MIKNFLVEDLSSEKMENFVENTINNNQVTESQTQTNVSNVSSQTEQKTNTIIVENKTENAESSSFSEMELDIQNLKKIYRFVKPLDAIVSSEFGARESEYQNVTGYHTGIDLAAEKGTSIKAAMQGIVELVSSDGDYRKTCEN